MTDNVARPDEEDSKRIVARATVPTTVTPWPCPIGEPSAAGQKTLELMRAILVGRPRSIRYSITRGRASLISKEG